MHTDDDVMAVNTQEWDLVARLLAVVAPHEDGACPGAQLSRHRASRIWTLTDGTMTVDVRCGGTIPGLGEPVWMTARAVWFAASTAVEDGPFCRVTIDDRRDENGTVTAEVSGDGYDARFDLPYRDPIPTLRPPVPDAVLATVTTDMSGVATRADSSGAHPDRRAGERPTGRDLQPRARCVGAHRHRSPRRRS